MIDVLEILLEESANAVRAARTSVLRHLSFPKAQTAIKVAIGMRRSGKTYFLYQVVNRLLDSGVLPEQILIVNFEDDRLLPMNGKQMGELLDSFYSIYPQNHSRMCYLLLDEVQNVQDWPITVRRYHDKKQVELYLTGSSAKLLSKEIATSLRGRNLTIEVWPYSFSEYIAAHDIALPSKPFGQKAYDVMREHILRYFEIGGFPAVQKLIDNEWRETLQNYVETVIMRDVVERHNVTNITLLKYLTKSLITNAASHFSVNKFCNDIKSQGYPVGKGTIYTYIDYLEDAYLIFMVPLYSESIRLRQTVPKKVYTIDTGLINATALKINDIYHKYFENLIYLDLRRQNKDVYYYITNDGYEVDFVTVAKDGTRELIQVTLDMSDPNTKERETRALKQAEKELGISGRIITLRDYLRDFC